MSISLRISDKSEELLKKAKSKLIMTELRTGNTISNADVIEKALENYIEYLEG